MDDKKTMTAEEVERTTQRLRASLIEHGLVSEFPGTAHFLVTVLAAQAARVPGLEERLTAVADERDDALAQRDAALELSRAAESTRDAAQKEVAGADSRERELRARTALAESDRDMAKGEVEVLRGQLKEARKDAGEAVAAYQDASERVTTLEQERVASDASHRDTEQALAAQRDTLEGCLEGAKDREKAILERVATLEGLAADRGTEALEAIAAYDKERARADTAEARVRELGAQAPWTGRVDGLREAAQLVQAERAKWGGAVITACDSIGRALDTRVEHYAMSRPGVRAHLAALASQPPPAPAQGKPSILDALTGLGRALRANSGGIHTLVTLEVSGDHYDTVSCGLMKHEYTRVYADRIHCETGEVPVRIVSKTNTPTPPPGLREAVLSLVQSVADEGDSPRVRQAARWLGQRLRAAYDATGGEHGPDATCPNCKADHEDAAKYRAAVGRLNDRAGQAKAAHDAWGSDPDGAVARWVLYGDGEAPAPREMLDKALVAEELAKEHGEQVKRGHWQAAAVLRHFGRACAITLDRPPSTRAPSLPEPPGFVGRFNADDEGPRPDPDDHWCKGECGEMTFDAPGGHEAWHREHARVSDTPPSGPGGGEDANRADECAEVIEHDGFGAAVKWAVQPDEPTRARIAPTPTPEVPPMERAPRAHGGHMGPKDVDVAIAFAPPDIQRKAYRALYSLAADYTNLRTKCAAESLARDVSQPEPSTPDVVWEWDGLGGWMVSQDGGLHCKMWLHGGVDGGWVREVEDYQPAIGKVAIQLARALAEAKREVDGMRKPHESVQYAHANRAWATAGGDVIAIHSARLEEDTAKAARKAAEAMRERAKAAILKQQATEEDGPASDDNGYAFNMLLHLADEVGKLPLE